MPPAEAQGSRDRPFDKLRDFVRELIVCGSMGVSECGGSEPKCNRR